MPMYKVLLDGKFGEGYGAGDIIEMDTLAAEVRVQLGEIVPVDDEAPKPKRRTRAKKQEESV